jgi:hypothetical protein
MTVYCGDRTIDGVVVTADGVPLPPAGKARRGAAASFEWGYEGSGPKHLAYALLFAHTRDAAVASDLEGSFMRKIVANLGNEWELTSTDVEGVVRKLVAA